MSGRDLSLDTPISAEDEEDATFGDSISAPHDNTEDAVVAAESRALMREKMHEFARTLKDKEEVIFRTRLLAEEPVSIGGGVFVTPQLSIGVTVRRPGETSDQLIERADDAMYLAKKAGRNRVVAID